MVDGVGCVDLGFTHHLSLRVNNHKALREQTNVGDALRHPRWTFSLV